MLSILYQSFYYLLPDVGKSLTKSTDTTVNGELIDNKLKLSVLQTHPRTAKTDHFESKFSINQCFPEFFLIKSDNNRKQMIIIIYNYVRG